MIPYGRQLIDDEDIKCVIDVLQSDWLTTGPKIAEFEKEFAKSVGAKYAVAVSSGTAALHAAMHAIGIKKNDEVIVPAISFAVSANCVVFQGGRPVFADVEADTLLLNPAEVEKKITNNTKAIIAVDYAGQPCDYDKLRDIAKKNNLLLIDDACHALGAVYKNCRVGSIADLNIFSFHPVKHITCGEGGMITTDDSAYAKKMRIFRNHGIATDHHQRQAQGSWYYEMVDLGYNYRITDFQCALGLSQLLKLPDWLVHRREIAAYYDESFSGIEAVTPLTVKNYVEHAYHLYVVKFDTKKMNRDRKDIFHSLREEGIGVNVHYIPIYLHPFYQKTFGTNRGLCPIAEAAYDQIISLPMYNGLSQGDAEKVVKAVKKVAL
ncbi:MAG: UDP-4-amino-4,6-dideoxy-N-acetyl-beta-L-altrosamine transaminase [PVC group bacterium]|nr:UDP-4-amino-4,6-dideoxy-N-acetyl-beta-L-altrosamine transaminase [PVC group bacterium]